MFQTSNKKTLVSVGALCKDFTRPNGKVFPVLEGIHLDVYDGEVLTLLGISGSGKTTLLRCMAGLLRPDRGQVTYAVPPPENSQAASFVFQNFALFPWLTVRENVEVAVQHVPKRLRKERIDDILELVGLKGFEDCYPRELSGGMKQRVSLCRALVADPMVVFMDEPFSALDPLTGQSLRAEVSRIWAQPDRKIRAMVLVTHNLSEAILMSDRIVILSANPGMVYKTIEVPLPRPRNPNHEAYKELESLLEKTFGELHLDKFMPERESDALPTPTQAPGGENTGTSASSHPKPVRARPLINTSLVLVEGLVNRLSAETEPMDLYDLCDDMGQSVDQMLPAVASGELLGFLLTPGTNLILTEFGRVFAAEQDTEKRQELFRSACLRLPIISRVYNIVMHAGDEGIEKDIAIEQIAMMLPFEDPDVQFEAFLKWCRHTNLITYDADGGRLFMGD